MKLEILVVCLFVEIAKDLGKNIRLKFVEVRVIYCFFGLKFVGFEKFFFFENIISNKFFKIE